MLDTNIILLDANSILRFGDNKVVIPLIVIEELDRFKRDQSQNGRNARAFSRLVDDLRKKGSLQDGVQLDNGGTLCVSLDLKYRTEKHEHIDLSSNDNLILATALTLKEQGENAILISKDINCRLKADVLGLEAQDYETLDRGVEELFKFQRKYDVSNKDLVEFEKNRFLAISEEEVQNNSLVPNEYLLVCETGNERHRLLGRYSKRKGGIVPLITMRDGVWGIYPKNVEQQFALDALMNDEINLVTLIGKAGTGKTLLAIASGLEKTIAHENYTRLLVSRPIQPMGKDLGFLPGDVNEKLGPWMQPIFDNMDFLFNQNRENSIGSYDDLINQGLLHVEPLTYIRGRSIPNQYLIVDEAQNLSPHEVKTIITRAGDGTKIILTGDCQQIDSPYLDEVNNGLTYCMDRLRSQEIVAHAELRIGERSLLSEIASKYL